MAVVSKLRIEGLKTADNELSSTPDGALVEANNVVIRTRNVIEPRRGQFSRSYGLPFGSPEEIFYFRDTLLVKHGDSLSRDTGSAFVIYENELGDDASFTSADSSLLRTKGIEAGLCFYFTTGEGIYVLDHPLSTRATPAGVPRPVDTFNALIPTSNGNAVGINKRVGYRLLFGKRDANDTPYLGPPMATQTVLNNVYTPTAQMAATVELPSGLTTDNFWRLYRTPEVDNLDEAGNVQSPGEEFFLAAEAFLTQDQIDDGSFTILDNTPETFLGLPLYTNPQTGEGSLQANDAPPFAKDIAYWNDRAWFANTKEPHSIETTMISPPFQGDVFNVAGEEYVAVQTNSDGDDDFTGYNTYFTGADADRSIGDLASAIESGARSLIQSINQNADTTGVVAFYNSLPGELPGKILFERTRVTGAAIPLSTYTVTLGVTNLSRSGSTVTVTTDFSGSLQGPFFLTGDKVTISAVTPHADFPPGTFTLTLGSDNDQQGMQYTQIGATTSVSFPPGNYTVQRVRNVGDAEDYNAGSNWSPELPVIADINSTSVQEIHSHRLHYSKLQQPEAVPALNYVDIGQPGRPILRIIPLRDRLFAFKQEGVYVVSGQAPFQVDLLDDTIRLIAPDTAVTVANQIHCLTTQGLMAVTEGGSAVISAPIEPDITRLFAEDRLALLKRSSFGVSHESDRLYSFWIPDETDEFDDEARQCTKAFVYGVQSGVWTTWSLDRTCGRVDPTTDILHMGTGNTSGDEDLTLVRERKTYTREDYFDETEQLAGPTSWDSATGIVNTTASGFVAVGDVIVDEVGGRALVVEVLDSNNCRVVVPDSSTWVGDTSSDYTLLKSYATAVKWKAIDAGDPTVTKQFRDLSLHFRTRDPLYKFSMTFSSDQVPTARTVDIINQNYDPDVTTPEKWGVHREPVHERMIVTQEHQRGTLLHIKLAVKEAVSMWALNGLAVSAEINSERNKK